MSHHNLNPKRTGVLFFDMLKIYHQGVDEATQRRNEPIVANCVRIMKAARATTIPIFYAKADHRPDYVDCFTQVADTDIHGIPWPDPTHPQRFMPPPTAGNWTSEVIDEIKPLAGDYIIAKHRWSAFHQTHLELSLRTRGIDTIVLAGGATEIGIASTAYAARDADFNMVIVVDACTSGNQDCHAIFMKRIFPRIARMRTTDQVIQMMSNS